MKMKNLGKIVLLLLLTTFSLHAGVKAIVDASNVMIGDTVTLSLEIDGKLDERPRLTKICGENIGSTSSATNIRSFNGTLKKNVTLSYGFTPKKNCIIEAIKVKIDGKVEQSQPIKIKVTPQSAEKNPDFILELSTNQKEVYVGEPFEVVLTFKQRHNNRAVDSKFVPFEAKNFWTKEQSDGKRFEENGFSITEHTFILAAQKKGLQHIGAAEIKIATRKNSRDSWGMWMQGVKWRSYFSNGINLEAKPLPQGLTLVGDFKIRVEADKTEIDANEGVNLTLTISGSGNFEDIGSLKPSVAGVSVFDEEGVTKAYIEDGEYKGVWSQKMAFVSQSDFTIPSISLDYFDPKDGKIKSIKTKSIAVKVRNSTPKANEKIVIERADESESSRETVPTVVTDWKFPLFIGVLAGLIIGFFLGTLPWKKYLSRKHEGHSVNISDRKAVLALLLQHLDDEEAVKMVELLEGNLFEGKSNVIDKKELKALLKGLES